MTNKDLFEGLNNIDENLIDEARPGRTVKVKKDGFTFNSKAVRRMTTVAAAVAIFVLGGVTVKFATAEKKEQEPVQVAYETVGVVNAQAIGEMYEAVGTYESFYNSLREVEPIDFLEDGFVYEESEKKAAAPVMDTNEEAVSSHSTTNVMTENVGEGDIALTDGRYIYEKKNSFITITDITAGEPGEAVKFKPDLETPSDAILEMYVEEGKLILVVSHYGKNGEETHCITYDLAKPQAPKLLGKMKQSGDYRTSRLVNGIVYLISNKYVSRPELSLEKALKKENITSWIPAVNDTAVSADCIFGKGDAYWGTLISTFDVLNPEKTIDAKFVMNGNDQIYVSGSSIYFYNSIYASSRDITNISKVNYLEGILAPAESTSVNGRIRDHFAICEKGDYFYVLATEDERGVSSNTLHIFDKTLKEIGAVGGIANDEEVYAARYVGDYVYFITYRNTDPLFVVDISNPAEPKVLGELMVEGFSEYLHPWDDTHVLGLGFGPEVDMDGDGMADQTLKVTMFNVANPCKPVEENYKLILNRTYYCEAMDNYKAILASPERNLFGFAGEDYYLLSYDSESGFNMIFDEELPYKNTQGFRGLYSGDNFYITGGSEIVYKKLQ